MHTKIIRFLVRSAQQAPSADNSQPWQIQYQDNTLSIVYDAQRISNTTFPPENPATLLALGALKENLIQASEAAGISVKWVTPSAFNHSDRVYFKAVIDLSENFTEIQPEQLPLLQRHTNRFSYKKQSIPTSTLSDLKKQRLHEARVIFFDQDPEIKESSHIVRKASEIRFRTREIHEWLAKSFRFGKQAKLTGDGLDVATLDLPPCGGSFLKFISNWQRMKWMNLIGAYKFMSIIDSKPVAKAPAIVAIIGKRGFLETLSAGQLMERIWIDLNAKGIAVHPYYVISDQINRYLDGAVPKQLIEQAEHVYNDATHLFQLGKEETVHMLFRVGYPNKKTKRSRRLPLEKISIKI